MTLLNNINLIKKSILTHNFGSSHENRFGFNVKVCNNCSASFNVHFLDIINSDMPEKIFTTFILTEDCSMSCNEIIIKDIIK